MDLVEFFVYCVLKDEMLRDRFIVGIRDLSLSEKLQTDPMLTLEKAKNIDKAKSCSERSLP